MRTQIIAADGTRFTVLPRARRTRNKIIALTCAIASTPFIIAALVGIGLAATGNAHPAIDNPAPLDKAIAACEKAPAQYQAYCIGLYLRPAYTLDNGGAPTHTPAGPAIVRECFAQGLDRIELGACLTQPIS